MVIKGFSFFVVVIVKMEGKASQKRVKCVKIFRTDVTHF